MSKFLNYFCEGYTCDGYVEFYWQNIMHVDKIALLDKQPIGTLSKLSEIVCNKLDCNIELIHCGLNYENILAIIINQKLAILECETFELISDKFLSTLRKNNVKIPFIFKLDTFIPCSPTPHEMIEIEKLTNSFHAEIEESRKSLARGKEVHDRWEHIYLGEIDFEKVDKYIDDCADKVCEIVAHNRAENSYETDRFLGAGTYDGSHDYIENLTDGCKKIYIQGYPGTAKSTLIKRIIKRVNACRFSEHIEKYHCGFDPQSLDMVIFRNAKLAIFDCTAPHQYTPNVNDTIFNVYEYATRSDVNKMFKEELASIIKEYKRCINESTQHLKNAESILKEINSIQFPDIYSTTVLADKYVENILNYI